MPTGVGPITKGAIAGKDTFHYTDTMVGSYDSDDQTDEDAVWAELERTRNWRVSDGRNLQEVPFHGADIVGSITGYRAKSGSFEYVRKNGADAVFDFLFAAAKAGSVLMLRESLAAISISGTTGADYPVVLGEGEETRDGNNDVVQVFNFAFADAYDESGNRIGETAFTIA